MIVQNTIYQRKVKLNVRALTEPNANAQPRSRSTEPVTGAPSGSGESAGSTNVVACGPNTRGDGQSTRRDAVHAAARDRLRPSRHSGICTWVAHAGVR